MSVEDEIKLMCTPCQLFQKERCLIAENRGDNVKRGKCEKAIKTSPTSQLLALRRIRVYDSWTWGWQKKDR